MNLTLKIWRQKDKNMRKDPRVAVCLPDNENPYRYAEIRGIVDEITEEGSMALRACSCAEGRLTERSLRR